MVAAGVAALFLFRQQNVMQGQLDEMQQADRAWVSIEPAVGSVVWDKDGVTVSLKYTVKNTGKSPAMHVEVQGKIVPWLASPGPFEVLKKMASDSRRIKPGIVGEPLFPRDTMEIFSREALSREEMAKYFLYLTKFKHSPTDPDMPLDAVNKDIGLTIVYVVDYTFDRGDAHHQHSCMARISRVDPNTPINLDVALPVEVNLSAPNVRLTNVGFGCEAD